MAYSEASKKATAKYKSQNYKRIPLDVPKAQYEEIKSAADAAGESVNGYIKRAVAQRMQQENTLTREVQEG